MTALADPLDTEPFPDTEQLGYQPRDMVLLGAGAAHVHLLRHLAKHPLIGATVTLVTPYARHTAANAAPNWVAGHTPLDDCTVALEPMVRRAGVRWLQRSVKALDAGTRNVLLDDGSTLQCGLLSIDTEPLHNRALTESALPGARKHALFALPFESFSTLWPKVIDLGRERALRIAVLGDGASAIGMAMAVRHVLPTASVTLVAGVAGAGHYAPAPLRQRLLRALKQRNITVLSDTATALDGQSVMLGCGAALACDVPMVAREAQPAAWIADSGLATNAQGFVAVDTCLRSTSHPHIWSMGAGTGPVLAANLVSAIAGQALQTAPAPRAGLQTQPCGNRYALGTWGPLTFEGHWVWWLAQWIDRRALARYRS